MDPGSKKNISNRTNDIVQAVRAAGLLRQKSNRMGRFRQKKKNGCNYCIKSLPRIHGSKPAARLFVTLSMQ